MALGSRIGPFILEAIRSMRFASSPLIVSFLHKYDRIPDEDRDRVPLEAIALAAKIDVRHFWGELMLAIRERSVSAVKAITIASHPAVMKKRIEFAMTPGGTRDRDALDTMLGALPSPKGPTFINKVFTTKDADETKQEVEEFVDDLDFMFPNAEVMQEKVTPMRQRLLDEGK